MEAIPTAVNLTSYAGESEDFMRTPFDELVRQIAAGTLSIQPGKIFHIDEIVEAHRCMDENKAGGKIVVLTWPKTPRFSTSNRHPRSQRNDTMSQGAHRHGLSGSR